MKRRQWMRRRSQLRRSRFKRTGPPAEPTAGKSTLSEYAQNHDRCSVCWCRGDAPDQRREKHHIQGRRRSGTWDIRNITMLCRKCHVGYHSGGARALTLGHILTAKLQECGEVDLPYLAWLRGRMPASLQLERLPEWAQRERDRASWR